ncbi:hypothetical protein DH2020_040479 [Rehmannia glutinosa]|uniref:Epidermal patterning factor-like protein n=1 Tax=Rehmannia glutinosa TaxID=99300 RepID=A0ABR0USU0_REHGL
MSSFTSLISSSNIAIVLLAIFFLLSPSYCLNHKHPSDTFRLVVVAEKTRLGSTPPSCHNKCNQCHPCMAVQVPPLPSHNRVQPVSAQVNPAGNRYSNYKPLGWKCRCGGHFYNP